MNYPKNFTIKGDGYTWDVKSIAFPFSYVHRDGSEGAIVERVGDDIKLSFTDGSVELNLWTEGDIKSFIEAGTWIVKGVGDEAFKLPTSPANKSEVRNIKINIEPIEEAVEALNRLAEAAKAAQAAMDNLKLSFD